jgi:HPt (histidine-containing phosphotransfer) domain-containing protein
MTPSVTTCNADCGVLAHRQTPEASYYEVLDLDGLRNRCMGNLELVQRVLEKFQQRLPDDLSEMERLLALRDVEQVARIAHRIKGTSATISAQGVHRAAAEIEDMGRAGRVTDIPMGLARLRSQWERYLDCVSALFSTVDASEDTERLLAKTLS